MLGYTRPNNRPALVKSFKQLEDGADVQVSEILAYQHSKISGADIQAPKIYANQGSKISGVGFQAPKIFFNQDLKISGRPMMVLIISRL